MLTACAASGIEGFDTAEIGIDDHELTVAVADTPALRQRGLRNIASLPDGVDGMLFVFEEPRPATFGMRDTRLPLDLWWFDAERALLGVTQMTPCPEEPCPHYASPGPVRWALETPAEDYRFDTGAVLSTGDNP